MTKKELEMNEYAPRQFTFEAIDDDGLIRIYNQIANGIESGKYTAPVYRVALDDASAALLRRGLA